MFTAGRAPENYALSVHFNGLSHLYRFVKREEERMSKRPPTLVHFTDFGSSDRRDVVLNHFIWYSNSFVPFIDLFSRAHKLPRQNLRREFHSVKQWRNKVAAHFSLVNPNRKRPVNCRVCGALIQPKQSGDSVMIQTASVNQFITWENGRFSVGTEVFLNVDTRDSTPKGLGMEADRSARESVGYDQTVRR